jgi:hypothetical protein
VFCGSEEGKKKASFSYLVGSKKNIDHLAACRAEKRWINLT